MSNYVVCETLLIIMKFILNQVHLDNYFDYFQNATVKTETDLLLKLNL
jgi:hypothetical protein